jgi:exportin-1
LYDFFPSPLHAHPTLQVHTFYEAVGWMISAQPNKPQQEKLIGKLMELPNNAVRALNSPCCISTHLLA